MKRINIIPAAASHGCAAALIQRRTAVLYALLVGTMCWLCYMQTDAARAGPSSAYKLPAQLTSARLENEIKQQQKRMDSRDEEQRRDAVLQLGLIARPESSRAAAAALVDRAATVRATATRAVVSLPPEEAAALLIPLLDDRSDFVRQEAAYALGKTKSRTAVRALVAVLERDRSAGARGAAAVALGEIADESAALPLIEALDRARQASGFLNRIRRRKVEENEFVRRAAARSLGQISSRAAVPVLIAVLSRPGASDDVRREAARALGIIGDTAAIPALRGVLTARDPYLARIAYEALRKLDAV